MPYHPSHIQEAKVECLHVPSIKVSLVKSIKLLLIQHKLISVRVELIIIEQHRTLLAEGHPMLEETGLHVESALVHTAENGLVQLVLYKMSGLTQSLRGDSAQQSTYSKGPRDSAQQSTYSKGPPLPPTFSPDSTLLPSIKKCGPHLLRRERGNSHSYHCKTYLHLKQHSCKHS